MTQSPTLAPQVLVISGSPTNPSRTEMLAAIVLRDLAAAGIPSRHLCLRDIAPQALVTNDMTDPELAAAVADVASAQGIVLATPTYKASFSGLLKLFLDLLPQFGFAGKAVLPLATGGTLAHVLALDYGLRPVIQSMGARFVVPSYFVTADAISAEGTGLAPKFRSGLDEVVAAFIAALPAPSRRAA